MVELWFECFDCYSYIQLWQYMLLCGVGAKPVAHLIQYHLLQWEVKPVAHLMQCHLLQWEVAKVKPLINYNMTLTVLKLHQKIPKGTRFK